MTTNLIYHLFKQRNVLINQVLRSKNKTSSLIRCYKLRLKREK